ncbi:MAG: hypothetical protein HZY79_07755 [Rhodoblastus sp.]|nr:MAG: hypothetical protein HZY79_07755 [Rhodoblastus sp.]
MGQKRIDWVRASTLVSVVILVGTELIGAAWAAGWAIGGLAGLPASHATVIEALGVAAGFAGLYAFVRAAVRHEPIFHAD